MPFSHIGSVAKQEAETWQFAVKKPSPGSRSIVKEFARNINDNASIVSEPRFKTEYKSPRITAVKILPSSPKLCIYSNSQQERWMKPDDIFDLIFDVLDVVNLLNTSTDRKRRDYETEGAAEIAPH